MMNAKKFFSMLAAALLLALPHQASAAIDPASVQKLVAADGAAGDAFGSSVSLSADGRTALIGATPLIRESGDKNSAYVFVKGADGRWSQKAKLTAKDEMAGERYITSVTLSADGNAAFIGHSYLFSFDQVATYHSGAVCVFVKGADGSWTQKAKLTGENSKEEGGFGDNVSLSADGNTALIASASGFSVSGYYVGSAYVFVRGADGRWSKQAKFPDLGGDVSLSADGGTALIGEGMALNGTDVFVRGTDGRWSKQAKLPDLGGDVSLSADGGTALIVEIKTITEINTMHHIGEAYIFVKGTDGTWNRKAKLIASDSEAGGFGRFASLSADGRMALIGGAKKSAYVFVRAADDSWSQQVKLTGPTDTFGSVVSLSADGSTALIGDYGAAYVYSSTAAPQSASKLP